MMCTGGVLDGEAAPPEACLARSGSAMVLGMPDASGFAPMPGNTTAGIGSKLELPIEALTRKTADACSGVMAFVTLLVGRGEP